MDLGGFAISPDATHAAFTARYANRRNDADKNEVYVIDFASGEKTRLTDNNAPENVASWSPDGKVFLYGAADDQEWMNRNSKIWVMDPTLQEYDLLSGQFEGNPGAPGCGRSTAAICCSPASKRPTPTYTGWT